MRRDLEMAAVGRALLVLVASLVVSAGCERRPSTGPVDIAWDRDACERCRMVISDRAFAAQVRVAPDGKARVFDDIGDALLWLEESGTPADEVLEIWVVDHGTGAWLDARTARFEPGAASPMGFGFSAHAPGHGKELDLDAVRAAVRERERARRSEAPS